MARLTYTRDKRPQAFGTGDVAVCVARASLGLRLRCGFAADQGEDLT